MCRLFISSVFAALLFKKYGMFNIFKQQLHQRFVTSFSMKLSLWNCSAILSTMYGIDYWIYEFFHRNINFRIGGIQILSSRLGYVSHGEYLRNGFSAGRYFEV